MITGHDSFGSSVCYTSSYGELDYGPESIEGVGESALVMKGGVVVGQSEWAGSVCFSDGSSLSVTLPGDLAHEDPPAAVQALLVEMTSRL